MRGTANLVLKGTRYYSAKEEYAKGRLRVGANVLLVHTPYNPYDSDAVAAFLMPSGKQLGHVSAQVAPKYAEIVDANRVKSAKVVSAKKSSSDFLRIEIRLKIGESSTGTINSVTGTTQDIPAVLIEPLRKDKYKWEKAHHDKAAARVATSKQSAAAARKLLSEAKDKLARCHLDDQRQAALKQNIANLESDLSGRRWIAAAIGAVFGGMEGDVSGALLGGIAGLVIGGILGPSKEIATTKESLLEFEISRRQYDDARRQLDAAENELRQARSALPPMPKSTKAQTLPNRSPLGPESLHTAPKRSPLGPESLRTGAPAPKSKRQLTCEEKPRGNNSAYTAIVDCRSCETRVSFLSTDQSNWQKCPGCGFTRRRIG